MICPSQYKNFSSVETVATIQHSKFFAWIKRISATTENFYGKNYFFSVSALSLHFKECQRLLSFFFQHTTLAEILATIGILSVPN